MSNKLKSITNMYEDTLYDITKSPSNWMKFLNSATWNFGYNFSDKVCIYMQRPDAIACAKIEDWNKKTKRWINSNSKGIALIKEKDGIVGLEYVFDVSDTHKYHEDKEYKLWKVEEKYENEIIEALESKFGTLYVKDNLANALYSAAGLGVNDNLQDYLTDLQENSENSLLEDLDFENMEYKFRKILSNSVAYMMLVRCNINPSNYFTTDDFIEISEFDTYDTIIRLGNATSDIAQMEIKEIKNTIKNLQKNNIYTFDNKNKMQYYNNINERRDVYERNNIHQTRRISNSRPGVREEEQRNSSWKIRQNEIELFKGKQESGISSITNERQINRTFDANSRGSNTESEQISRKYEEKREYNRTNERKQSDGMGRENEPYKDISRGNSNERTDLQLEKIESNLPNIKEQVNIIEQAEVENTSVFSFTQEMIDNTLKNGSGFSKGKFRIYNQFQKSLSTKENIEFLKNEYGIGGSSNAYPYSEIGQNHNAKGITLYKGYETDAPKLLLSWVTVEKRIRELIQDDRYLNTKEKEEYKNWLDNQTTKLDNIKAEDNYLKENKNDNEVEKEYEYKIGDTVYIGLQEYEISTIGQQNISLYDPLYPLFGKEMSIQEFNEKIKDNPLNDHLLKSDKANAIELNAEEVLIEDEETENKIEEENENLVEDKNNIEVNKDLKPSKNIINQLRKKENRLDTFNLHPEISIQDRNQFKISNNSLGEGTPKEKYRKNIDAIKVLKKCEEENRYATKEEQEILSDYVGWGGLPEVFDEQNTSWSNEYIELKNLLTEEEYSSARASTLTAFYTPPIVIKSMYNALEKFGFKTGNILEPSCGIGNFIGNIPEKFAESKIYGVELDGITGKIAQQLYQKSTIAVQGYENTNLPDSFFDIAIGNVPFGDFKVSDKRYDKNKFLIHDYFFAKTIDKVRPRRNYSIYNIKRNIR